MEIKNSLKTILKRLKLSGILATLPERIAYAQKTKLPSEDLLELILQDEVDRRDQVNLQRRLKRASFTEEQIFENFDWDAPVVLFFTLNREDFSFVIHLDRQPRTRRRREAQTGSRARSGSRSERTLSDWEHSRTLMEWWPFLIFHRGGLRIKVINNRWASIAIAFATSSRSVFSRPSRTFSSWEAWASAKPSSLLL